MLDFLIAIKRPFTDIKKLIIGILISIVPVVNFIAYGYFVECIKLSLKNKNDLPEWKNFGNLFVNGSKLIAISVIYTITGIIVIVLSIIKLIISEVISLQYMDMPSILIILNLLKNSPLFYMGIILFLIGSILGSAAVVRFVKDNKFASAFSLGDVFNRAFTGRFILAYLIGNLIFLIALAFDYIPFIGYAIRTFIAGVIFYTLIALAYRE